LRTVCTVSDRWPFLSGRSPFSGESMADMGAPANKSQSISGPGAVRLNSIESWARLYDLFQSIEIAITTRPECNSGLRLHTERGRLESPGTEGAVICNRETSVILAAIALAFLL
jgi:hypothetical protein